MSAWPQLSAPIYAGDNFRMAVNQSQATVGRPPARPTSKDAPSNSEKKK